MRADEVERLIRRLEGSDVTALTVSDATWSLTLRISPRPTDTAATAGEAPADRAGDPQTLHAPAIGRLLLRHPEAALSDDGSFPRSIRSGDIVAFLDCGVILRPVVADRDGRIGAPMQTEGDLVGFGTPLFEYLSGSTTGPGESDRHGG